MKLDLKTRCPSDARCRPSLLSPVNGSSCGKSVVRVEDGSG